MTAEIFRLFVALYVRDGVLASAMPGKEDLYHWAFLILPNQIDDTTRALRLNARNYFSGSDEVPWYYEEIRVPAKGTPKLLATILVGEILDMDRLLEILRDIPIVQDDVTWNCVTWVKGALDELYLDGAALKVEGVGTDWLALRNIVLEAAVLKASQYKPANAR